MSISNIKPAQENVFFYQNAFDIALARWLEETAQFSWERQERQKVCDLIYQAKFTNATSLDFRDCHLNSLPEVLTDLIHVKHIYLVNNRFEEFPEVLCNLHHLESIEIGDNQIQSLPPTIGNLKNLKLLNIRNNILENLPDELYELNNLETLNLSHNKIEFLSEKIFNLKKLQLLCLRNNHLQTLPDILSLAMFSLYIENNPIKKLPQSFWQSNIAKGLDVTLIKAPSGEVYLDVIDPIFNEKLQAWVDEPLENVSERHDRRAAATDILYAKKTYETTLNLNLSGLSSLPEILIDLIDLEEIEMEEGKLTAFPAVLCYLPNLKSINLKSNKIKTLPKDIINARNLQKLIIMSNEIENLPDEFYELRNLEYLDLSDNKLKSLSDDCIKLTKLTWLNLMYNHLETLPTALLKINVKELHTQNNPIKELPIEFTEISNETDNPKYMSHDLWHIPFDQQDLIEQLDPKKNQNLMRFIKKFNGLCDLMSNQILREGLLGNQDRTLLKRRITLESLSAPEIIESHIADIHSLFHIQLGWLCKSYPDNIFSFSEQRALIQNGRINRDIVRQGLEKMQEGETVKGLILSKKEVLTIKGYSLLSTPGGHSVLIEKMVNNKYIFCDVNQGEFRYLSFSKLCDKLQEVFRKWEGVDIYLTKGSDFLKRVDKARAESASWEKQGSISSHYSFTQP